MGGEVKIERRLSDAARAQTGSGVDVQSKEREPGYFGVPMLQVPVWEGPFIGTYFFLGGLSGGAYVLSRMAQLFGGREFRDLRRAGSTVAFLSSLPCAPLLIADLGDASRFHHMLRVFKPKSPMNLGTWVLTGYGASAAGAVFREWLKGKKDRPATPAGKIADKSLAVVTDAAGIPLAMLLMSYTGVLLTGSATPVWVGNKWLAPLFTASAVGNGAGAISLAMQLTKKPWEPETRAERALDKVDTAAHIAEVVLLVQYLTSLGRLNRPLTRGRESLYMKASTGAVIASEVLKYLPLHGRARRWARLASAGLGMLSGMALKYGILEAGTSSVNDPQAARISSSPQRRLADRRGNKSPFPAKAGQAARQGAVRIA